MCSEWAPVSPKISHVIPLWVFQLLKSERWNFAVFEMLARSAVRELRAELMGQPRLLRRECCALVRRLRRCARRLLGAGVRLDIFGGEGTLRGALAAVGALP